MNKAPRSPPSALKKRMERLNSLPDPSFKVTIYKDNEITKLKSGLSAEDQEIADRLQQLKASQKQPSEETEEEISVRLAKLKGVDIEQIKNPGKGLAKNPVHSNVAKSDVFQEQDLLKQMSDELELEKNMPNPDDELAARLAKLRGVDVDIIKNPGKGLDKKPSSTENQSNEKDIDLDQFLPKDGKSDGKLDENINDDELAKDIVSINKELSEMKAKRQHLKTNQEPDSDSNDDEKEEIITQVIESLKLEDHDPVDDEDEFKQEEYPWCIICNEDATLRCKQCDGDLYCKRCFKECHRDADIRDHVGETYKKQPNKI